MPCVVGCCGTASPTEPSSSTGLARSASLRGQARHKKHRSFPPRCARRRFLPAVRRAAQMKMARRIGALNFLPASRRSGRRGPPHLANTGEPLRGSTPPPIPRFSLVTNALSLEPRGEKSTPPPSTRVPLSPYRVKEPWMRQGSFPILGRPLPSEHSAPRKLFTLRSRWSLCVGGVRVGPPRDFSSTSGWRALRARRKTVSSRRCHRKGATHPHPSHAHTTPPRNHDCDGCSRIV